MKQYGYRWICWGLLAMASFYLKNAQDIVSAYPLMAFLKYSTAAGTILLFPILLLATLRVPKIQRSWLRKLCFYSGYCITLFYLFLTMDTYLFHTWTWYPGILRYAVYDAYGWLYLVFIIPGCLLYGGSKEVVS